MRDIIGILTFLIVFFISFTGCGEKDEEVKDVEAPTVTNIDVADGQEITESRSITVNLSEEMVWVNIVISGATGKTMLDSIGKIAVWIPSGNIPSGDHKITITGQDKAGNDVENYKPINFKVASKMDNKQLQAYSFWYPGETNSQWIYDIPQDGQVTSRISGYLDIGGKSYKVVKESDMFMGIVEAPDPTSPDPFLTFRKGDSNQVLGYGTVGNKLFGDSFIEMLKELGFDEKSIKIQHKYNEWILLDKPEVNLKWTIMQMSTKVTLNDVTINGIFELKGYISRKEKLLIETGEFETYVVEYTTIDEVEGEKQEDPLINLWLSPDVGLIQTELENSVLGRLARYKIVSSSPAPASYNKTLTNNSDLINFRKELDIRLRKLMSTFVDRHVKVYKEQEN
jgi:hypothetical protein